MVILIAGASYVGKTLLAQKLLEKYKYPYLSIDHLKMSLIRSKNTKLTPTSDDKDLTAYLWPIVCEMARTVIENEQNLIVEGCYIPFNWKDDFEEKYLQQIRYICLIMTKKYIDTHFDDIMRHKNKIEKRISNESTSKEELTRSNEYNLEMCRKYNNKYILIDDAYELDFEL